MIYIQHGHDGDRGSFAVVMPALEVDDETGSCRQVAVKRLRSRSEFPSGKQYDQLHDQAVRLFEHERRIWCTLSPNPGVVTALKASRIDGEPVLLLEYIYGATLEEILTGPNGPLHPVELLNLSDQLGSALSHLHENCRLAHGDVSTQNLLYDGEGLIRLADLGFAAPIGEKHEAIRMRLTLRAPEQDDALHASPAIDVWKAGVCVLLAARGESLASSTTRHHDFCGPRSFKALVEESVQMATVEIQDGKLTDSLRRLLLQALAPDPTKRLRNGGELAEAVRDFRASNVRWDNLLERQRKQRRRLRFWNRTAPRTADDALNELQSLGAELLSADYVSPSHRLLPETPYLLARAAWLSSEGSKQYVKLLELAHSLAQISVNSFDGDPRPLEIMVHSGKALREAFGARGNDLRNEQDLVRIFRKFKTFVRAHHVRELESDLVRLENQGNQNAKMLRQEAHVALAEFDERLLQHYKKLEDRLIDQPT
jgi:serine/threonine protein kinase